MKKTLLAGLIGLALSTAAFGKEKIDFMFPSPVEGKFTQEMTRVIKNFNDSQDEVEVRGIFTGDYDTTKMKAEAALQAGTPPALAIMSANYTADLAMKDEIVPMDELFTYAPDSQKDATQFLKDNYWQGVQKNALYQGKAYAIPFHNSTPILYYNKQLFQEAGIEHPPQTWDELLADAKKLTKPDAGQWGIMLPSTNNDYGGWVLSALVHANGGSWNNPDYPGEVYYSQPSTKGVLQFWQNLVYRDKVMPEGVLNSKQINAAFLSGKLGMAILSTGSLGFMTENAKNIDFDVAMLPAKVRRGVIIGGASLVSFKGTTDAQKKAAYQFLTYLSSPEVNGAWSRFSGYFAPRKAAYGLPEMQAYLKANPRAETALQQLQYAYPWYSTYETVPVRQVMENTLAEIISNPNSSVDALADKAQQKADELLKPYQTQTALKLP